jgi:hypothetical protein
MINTFLTFICCIKLLIFVPSTRCTDVGLYPQFDEELPQDLGLFSPDEVELPGNFTINNIRFELGAVKIAYFSAR